MVPDPNRPALQHLAGHSPTPVLVERLPEARVELIHERARSRLIMNQHPCIADLQAQAYRRRKIQPLDQNVGPPRVPRQLDPQFNTRVAPCLGREKCDFAFAGGAILARQSPSFHERSLGDLGHRLSSVGTIRDASDDTRRLMSCLCVHKDPSSPHADGIFINACRQNLSVLR